MKKSFKREIATSFTTFLFLVIGITGVMMFFHILDNYTKDIHEILGLVFVLIVIFHVIYNWNSMKNYFSKKVFSISASIVAVVSLIFILNAPTGENPKKIVFNSLMNAPIEKSFALFDEDFENLKSKLLKEGIEIKEEKSLKELAKANNTSPFKIISIVAK